MLALVDLVATLGGFGLVVVAATRLNGGAPIDFSGLFPSHGRSDWPRGVQEGDAPHFAVDHLDGLRPPGSVTDTPIHELDVVEPAIPGLRRLSWDVHRVALKR